MRESLINQLIGVNSASVALNLRGGRHGHLILTMAAEDYMEQTGYAFVPPQNPGNYLPTMGTAQDQAFGTERFRKNQTHFRRCTAEDGELKIWSSWRYNQSYCPHWCTGLRDLDR